MFAETTIEDKLRKEVLSTTSKVKQGVPKNKRDLDPIKANNSIPEGLMFEKKQIMFKLTHTDTDKSPKFPKCSHIVQNKVKDFTETTLAKDIQDSLYKSIHGKLKQFVSMAEKHGIQDATIDPQKALVFEELMLSVSKASKNEAIANKAKDNKANENQATKTTKNNKQNKEFNFNSRDNDVFSKPKIHGKEKYKTKHHNKIIFISPEDESDDKNYEEKSDKPLPATHKEKAIETLMGKKLQDAKTLKGITTPENRQIKTYKKTTHPHLSYHKTIYKHAKTSKPHHPKAQQLIHPSILHPKDQHKKTKPSLRIKNPLEVNTLSNSLAPESTASDKHDEKESETDFASILYSTDKISDSDLYTDTSDTPDFDVDFYMSTIKPYFSEFQKSTDLTTKPATFEIHTEKRPKSGRFLQFLSTDAIYNKYLKPKIMKIIKAENSERISRAREVFADEPANIEPIEFGNNETLTTSMNDFSLNLSTLT